MVSELHFGQVGTIRLIFRKKKLAFLGRFKTKLTHLTIPLAVLTFLKNNRLIFWTIRVIFMEKQAYFWGKQAYFSKKTRLFFQKVAFRSTLTPRWQPTTFKKSGFFSQKTQKSATFNLKNSGNHYWDPGSIFRDDQGRSLGP